jgi:hypothetical protein
LIDPISTGEHPDPKAGGVDGWAIAPTTVSSHLEALLTVASQSHGLPAPARVGRGIVTVGGGKYWLGIVIGLKMLRSIGCDLPVEIWYGEGEEVHAKDLEGLGPVSLHPISKSFPDVRTLKGWANKLYALTHTSLKEVLFLDADAYLVADPEPLFAKLQEAPFVFWSDMDFHNADIDWERVYSPGCKKGLPVIQGGQLVMDTQLAWPLLRLTHWICQHADYYFGRMYGDQDAWRVALSVLHWCQAGLHLGKAEWVHPCFVCSVDGVELIVHRCQSKFFLNKIPGESKALAWYAEALASG